MLRRGASAAVAVTLLAGCGIGSAAPPLRSAPAPSTPVPTAPGSGLPAPAPPPIPPVASAAPNIVFVLVDDLSTDLVAYMDEVQGLADEGVSFDNFFVTTSLCCPSRASTFSGKYPHNSHVLTNGWPLGGFMRFVANDLETSLGPDLQAAGYRTGFMGKFMNGYEPAGSAGRRASQEGAPDYPQGYVPPGWDEWHAAGKAGYQNFRYPLATAIDERTATVERFGAEEEDYLTDVLATRAEEFIDRAVSRSGDSDVAEPFFLMVAPFAVHAQHRDDVAGGTVDFAAAPRDRPAAEIGPRWPAGWDAPEFTAGDCGGLNGGCDTVAFPPPEVAGSFNVVPRHPPAWMKRTPLDTDLLGELERQHLERVRMAQSVDDLIGRVRAQLVAAGVDDETYIVVNSDNGFHLGAHSLGSGKLTAYDHDIRVPLIIRPPGGTAPRTVTEIVQNTDLLPTFRDLAGQHTGRWSDGVSLLPLLSDLSAEPNWRTGALVEYRRDERMLKGADPDWQRGREPSSYNALRTEDYLYVDYSLIDEHLPAVGEAELYDLRNDPDQLVNVFANLGDREKRMLERALQRYVDCAGSSCERAGRLLPTLF